eukprot:g13959.t1
MHRKTRFLFQAQIRFSVFQVGTGFSLRAQISAIYGARNLARNLRGMLVRLRYICGLERLYLETCRGDVSHYYNQLANQDVPVFSDTIKSMYMMAVLMDLVLFPRMTIALLCGQNQMPSKCPDKPPVQVTPNCVEGGADFRTVNCHFADDTVSLFTFPGKVERWKHTNSSAMFEDLAKRSFRPWTSLANFTFFTKTHIWTQNEKAGADRDGPNTQDLVSALRCFSFFKTQRRFGSLDIDFAMFQKDECWDIWDGFAKMSRHKKYPPVFGYVSCRHSTHIAVPYTMGFEPYNITRHINHFPSVFDQINRAMYCNEWLDFVVVEL